MSDLLKVLQMREPARFDPDRLEKLCDLMGEHRAEAEVADALSRIATLLREISTVEGPRPRAWLHRRLDALIAASDRIGMATLARVGGDARACLRKGDPVGLAATLSRLDRVGERSLHAVWDLDEETS